MSYARRTWIALALAGIMLLLTAALFLFYSPQAREAFADEAATSATVGNSDPTVANVSLNSGGAISLTENTTTAVTCTADVTDANGCDDINATTGVDGLLFKSGITATLCDDFTGGTDDDADICYSASCTRTGSQCSSPDFSGGVTYTCTFNVQYFAEPQQGGGTGWTCSIQADDGNGGTEGVASNEQDLNDLLALNVDGGITYGSLALGATTLTTNHDMTVTNTGNVTMDIDLNGKAGTGGNGMDCTFPAATNFSEIPVGNQKFGLTDVTYASLSTALAATAPVTPFDASVVKATSDANPSIDHIYWGLQMPSTGIGGTCTGTNEISAAADQ